MARDRASTERLWEFQTRLMENVVEIFDHYRSNSSAVTTKPAQGYATYMGTIPPTMTTKIDAATPTLNTAGSISLLSQEDSLENYKFIDLPASIVQKLTPKVEVYKVYPPKNEGKSDRAYLLHQGVHSAEDIRRELRRGDIKASDNNRQGVVLQAVDFTRLGGNPAEVHTNIKFNIKLYAKSITEFFTKTDSFPDGTTFDEADFAIEALYEPLAASFDAAERARDTAFSAQAASNAVVADLLAAGQDEAAVRASNQAAQASAAFTEAELALAGATPEYRRVRQQRLDETDFRETAWIDIIKIDPGQELTADVGSPGAANRPPPASNELQVVEKDVRVKVKIGYSLPETKPSDIIREDWTKWQETVEKQKEEFFLSLLKHEWSFLGMQGVELSVDFIATGNAEILSPSSDLFGGLDYEAYRKLKTQSSSVLEKDVLTHSETLSDLLNDTSIRQGTIEEKQALLVSAEATKSVHSTAGNSAEEALSRGIIDILNSDIAAEQREIEQLEEKIESCEDKIGELQEELERHVSEINNTKVEYKTRLLRQLVFDYGLTATSTNMNTRVYRARVPTTLSVFSNIAFSYPTPSGGAFSAYSSGEAQVEAWASQDVAAVRGDSALTPRATLEGDDNVYTVGDFVFVGDIFEAAFECLYLQNADTSQQISALEEILNTARAEVADEGASVGRETSAERAQTTAARNLRRAQRKGSPPLASFEANDFQNVLKKVRTITTGKVTYPHPVNPDLNWLTLNISDIPISLDLFRVWWIEKTRTNNSYPMRDFIADFMTFVSDMFKNLKYRKGVSPMDVTSQLPEFILNNVSYDDTLFAEMTNESGKYIFVNNSYFQQYLSAAKAGGTGKTITVIEQADVSDMPRGDVPNIIFGQADKGILKQVSFEREDIPGHAEARLMTDRDSVASNIALREKYNVTLEMRGTTSFLPGSVLYLDITPIELGYTDEDNSYAKQLGLGGMYRVVSVQSSLGLDGKGNSWTTRLKTKWESFGDGTNGDPNTAINNTLIGGDCN